MAQNSAEHAWTNCGAGAHTRTMQKRGPLTPSWRREKGCAHVESGCEDVRSSGPTLRGASRFGKDLAPEHSFLTVRKRDGMWNVQEQGQKQRCKSQLVTHTNALLEARPVQCRPQVSLSQSTGAWFLQPSNTHCSLPETGAESWATPTHMTSNSRQGQMQLAQIVGIGPARTDPLSRLLS